MNYLLAKYAIKQTKYECIVDKIFFFFLQNLMTQKMNPHQR